MKNRDLIEILKKLPLDYDITYINNIGHINLTEKQIICIKDTKEIILQAQIKI